MSSESRDYALLHFHCIDLGFTAILGVAIKMPPVEVVFYRTLIAAIGLYVVVSLEKKR